LYGDYDDYMFAMSANSINKYKKSQRASENNGRFMGDTGVCALPILNFSPFNIDNQDTIINSLIKQS